jgi:hypothetical protein
VAFHSVVADLTERKKQDPMSVAFHWVVANLTERKKETRLTTNGVSRDRLTK